MTTTLNRDQVTITPCACGRLVRLTTRWEYTCGGCGQNIESGAVGPLTSDDCRPDIGGRHGWGTWSYQHRCGSWNPPLEVTVELDDFSGDQETAVAWGLAELAALVAEDQERTRERIRDDLADLADRAVVHLPDHHDECWPVCPLNGTDTSPGAWLHDGVVTAWAWDPTTGGDGEWDTIEIERAAS